VVNTDFDQAVRDLASIFRANRLRTPEQEIRNRAMIASLLAGAPASA
jgi:guanylate kinase